MGAENYLGVMRQDDVPVDRRGPAHRLRGRRRVRGHPLLHRLVGRPTARAAAPNTGAFLLPAQLARPLPEARAQGASSRQDQPDLRGRQHGARPAGRPPRHRALRLPQALPPPDRRRSRARRRWTRWRRSSTTSAPRPTSCGRWCGPSCSRPSSAPPGARRSKRPFEVVVSAMRAAAAQFPFVIGNGDTDSFLWLYGNTGQQLFSRRSPDGYPDKRAAWMAPNPRVGSWRLCTWLMNEPRRQPLLPRRGRPRPRPACARPTSSPTSGSIASSAARCSAADRTAVVDFMAQGLDPDLCASLERLGQEPGAGPGGPALLVARIPLPLRAHDVRPAPPAIPGFGRPHRRAGWWPACPRLAFGDPDAVNDELVVVVFLRGGMDGLSLAMPLGGADRGFYEAARPRLKIPVTGHRRGAAAERVPAACIPPPTRTPAPRGLAVRLYSTGSWPSCTPAASTTRRAATSTPRPTWSWARRASGGTGAGWLTRHFQTAGNLPPDIIMPSLAVGSSQQASPARQPGDDQHGGPRTPSRSTTSGTGEWRHAQRVALRQMIDTATTRCTRPACRPSTRWASSRPTSAAATRPATAPSIRTTASASRCR